MSSPYGLVPLPAPRGLVTNDPFWRYPSQAGAGEGIAHLRVWRTGHGHLAIVSEVGLGASITNSAEHIYAALAATYGARGLIVLEHWPADQDLADEEHLDQVQIADDGTPYWRRIWPTPPTNPHHRSLDSWMWLYGHDLLNTSSTGNDEGR